MFGATNIVKISGKSKYVHNGSGIAFNGAGSWSFDNDAAINVLIFGADNNWKPHTDHHKNNFKVLREGPTNDNDDRANVAEKMFSINFSKA